MASRKDARKDTSDRLPPHSIEAEAGVLGCIFLQPTDCMLHLVQQFPGPEVFYDLRHRTVYELLNVMHDAREDMDLFIVQQRLKDKGLLDAVGGLAYLSDLPNQVPSASHVARYAKIVFEKYRIRMMIQGCARVIERCYDDEESAMSGVESFQKDLASLCTMSPQKKDWDIKPAIRTAIKKIEHDIEMGGALTGLATGFVDLDRKTRGLQGGDWIILAARPGLGKSSLVMNIADHVAVNNRFGVGLFSLEMSKEMVVRRMMSARARVNLFEIGQDMIAGQQLTKAAGQLASAPLYIDDCRGQDDVQIRASMRRMVYEHGIKVAIVDYLQLLHTRRRYDKRLEEVAAISSSMKDIAGELNIPVIGCAQLNREVEKDKNQRPRISQLREAGNLEQDADVIGLIYPTNPGQEESRTSSRTPCALDIAKHRNGPTGTINLDFLRSIMRFQKPGIDDADIPADKPTQAPVPYKD